ncbi:urea transporter [Vibrio sp. YMD68]|uniref:urea transporter n=1 Tax=Vibrio sp. YMD68 TaxID=3042300 RepID=UPI00249A7167|nr:urea transporter [Vibrio sp. YMD68]WGV98576.1 urea transporter [Vibrio sp. YMD68]
MNLYTIIRALYGQTLVLLRGMGQVTFQENAVTGVFVAMAVSFHSLPLFSAMFAGLWVSTWVGKKVCGNKQEVTRGLYGYNGALVGLAFYTLFQPIPLFWMTLSIFVASAICSVIQSRWRSSLPIFTVPFLLVTLLFTLLFILVEGSFNLPFSKVETLTSLHNATQRTITILDGFQGTLSGVGQILFLQPLMPSVLILIGIACSSRSTALWACVGSACGMMFAVAINLPDSLSIQGLCGFSASLTAIALSQRHEPSQRHELSQSRSSLRADILAKGRIMTGVILAASLSVFSYWLGVVTLTLPFVLSCWILLFNRTSRPSKPTP